MESTCPFVSRAGLKLAGALDAFGVSVSGWVCADFGCNVGGFTDCLLQRGAGRVYAVDTGYGALAWKLRRDARVAVLERTNVLRAEPPQPVDLVAVDVGWTPQRLVLPAAARWVRPGGQIISLLKPQYEATADKPRSGRHVLTPAEARAQCLASCQDLAPEGWTITAVALSGLPGAGGNEEFFLWLRRHSPLGQANAVE